MALGFNQQNVNKLTQVRCVIQLALKKVEYSILKENSSTTNRT